MTAPTDLWTEDGDELWLRADLAENAGKARYIALIGRGLPAGFGDGGCTRLIDICCTVTYCRPCTHEEGGGDGMWKRCLSDTPGAVKYWGLTVV